MCENYSHCHRDLLFEQLMAGDPPGSHVFAVGDTVYVGTKSAKTMHQMVVYEVFNYTTGQFVYASAKGLGAIRFSWLTKFSSETALINGHHWFVSRK